MGVEGWIVGEGVVESSCSMKREASRLMLHFGRREEGSIETERGASMGNERVRRSKEEVNLENIILWMDCEREDRYELGFSNCKRGSSPPFEGLNS